MAKSLKKNFYEFISERIEKALMDALESPEYIRAQEQYAVLMKNIDTNLKMKIDDVVSHMKIIEQDYVYKQSFFDFLQLIKEQNAPIDYTELEIK